MKMTYRLSFLAFIAISLFALTSCDSVRMYKDTKQSIQQNQDNIQAVKNTDRQQPAAVTQNGYYVDDTPSSLEKPPEWSKYSINLQGENLPLSFYVQRILSKTGALVNYQAGMDKNKSITLHYNGTIKGALDELAAKSGYSYDIKNNQVDWTAFVNKTFDISFMPGTSTYLVGQSAATIGASGGNTTASSSSGSGTNVVTTKGGLDDQQYSNLKGSLSVWDDLSKTLHELKSPDGKVVISEATTTVTVYDHPQNVRMMDNYIKELNKDMSEQVSIRVQVLELDLKKEFQYGVDWNLIIDQAIGKTQLSLISSLGQVSSGSVNDVNRGVSLLRIGQESGSNAVLNALAEQGKLSVVTQPRVTTMNDQMAEIRITQDTGYLQSVSTNVVNQTGVTTTLTPGVVTDGFTLYLLPKIQQKNIYLQISSVLSTLTDIQSVSNVASNNQANNPNAQTIQVPTLSEKRFNQRTMVRTGQTLIVAGFRQLRDSTRENALMGVTDLGAKGGQKKNVETIVLITPVIIKNNS